MSIYEELNVPRVINAATTFTALGGSLMPPAVLHAMQSAAGAFIDMHELHLAAGKRLAQLTHNEAAHVTSGCGAAMVLAILAARNGGDPGLLKGLPDHEGAPHEVIMHAGHRIPYDKMVQLAGAEVRQIGDVQQTFTWELEAAIGKETAAGLVRGRVAPAAGRPSAAGRSCDRTRTRDPSHRRRSRPTASTGKPLALHQRHGRRPGPLLRRKGASRTTGIRPDGRHRKHDRSSSAERCTFPALGATHESGKGRDSRTRGSGG